MLHVVRGVMVGYMVLVHNITRGVNNMKTFETGKSYSTRSICDHNCIFEHEILRRTAKSVYINVHGKVVRRSISIYDDREQFFPYGKYSMCAVISAS